MGAGLPALLTTYRNDEGAPADPSGEHRYGDTEWGDVEDAVGCAVDHGAERMSAFLGCVTGAEVPTSCAAP